MRSLCAGNLKRRNCCYRSTLLSYNALITFSKRSAASRAYEHAPNEDGKEDSSFLDMIRQYFDRAGSYTSVDSSELDLIKGE